MWLVQHFGQLNAPNNGPSVPHNAKRSFVYCYSLTAPDGSCVICSSLHNSSGMCSVIQRETMPPYPSAPSGLATAAGAPGAAGAVGTGTAAGAGAEKDNRTTA